VDITAFGPQCGYVSSNEGSEATVLVVDDEQKVADVQALTLQHTYETRVAYGGREALEKYDESVDAVVLDRRMPDIHGDDVLAEIREHDQETVVVMMTAVDPDLNILEMGFDDYLTKPVDAETLVEALDRQLDTRKEDDPRLTEFFSTVSKLDVLESELPRGELADSEEYVALKERADELASELDADHDDFDELVATFRDISRGSA
jgi:DNA-binding response OmpR family regulator